MKNRRLNFAADVLCLLLIRLAYPRELVKLLKTKVGRNNEQLPRV
jgi:hypothetical protein